MQNPSHAARTFIWEQPVVPACSFRARSRVAGKRCRVFACGLMTSRPRPSLTLRYNSCGDTRTANPQRLFWFDSDTMTPWSLSTRKVSTQRLHFVPPSPPRALLWNKTEHSCSSATPTSRWPSWLRTTGSRPWRLLAANPTQTPTLSRTAAPALPPPAPAGAEGVQRAKKKKNNLGRFRGGDPRVRLRDRRDASTAAVVAVVAVELATASCRPLTLPPRHI